MTPQELLPNEILALTIYGEARGESLDGQVAIGNVVMNRFLKESKRYKTINDVCLAPLQFSCWNELDPNRVKLLAAMPQVTEKNFSDLVLKQCYFIAQGVMGGWFQDNTHFSSNYMTNTLFHGPSRPKWASFPINTPIQIGNHTFFNI